MTLYWTKQQSQAAFPLSEQEQFLLYFHLSLVQYSTITNHSLPGIFSTVV